MITEKPRLLNQEMIKAVLSGRKTQTRQPIKYSYVITGDDAGYPDYDFVDTNGNVIDIYEKCPFGKPGDVLWFRETFRKTNTSECGCSEHCLCGFGGYEYLADTENCENKWTPSIHMPREACRIFGLVKKVWVERIQNILDCDAGKEGVSQTLDIISGYKTYKNTFQKLWDSIYKVRIITDEEGNKRKDYSLGWDKNPWIWCCEFEVMTKEQYEDYKSTKQKNLCASAPLRENSKKGGE